MNDDEMNEEEIIQEVKKRVDQENIKFLIWFGTRPGRDIDLLIVLKEAIKVRPCKPSKPKLDILMITNSEFMKRLALLDPAVTDSLITGFVLLGNEEEIGLLRSNTILSLSGLNKVPEETIQFLRAEACKRLQNARNLLKKGNRDNWRSFLAELSWACGYDAFADSYEIIPEWITFDYLVAVNGRVLLKEVLGALELVKSGRNFNKSRMISLFKKTQKMLGVID